MKSLKRILSIASIAAISATLLVGCGGAKEEQGAATNQNELSGEVRIDGSSTVFPITEAVAEEFMAKYPNVRVTVGVSGTGGGFKKFVVNEIDINDASRPIKDKEIEAAKENNVEAIEIPVAYDGLSVVVNKDNDFVDQLTIEELNKIWAPDSKVTKWSEVREGWPAEEIKLYGPGTDSGTFDYFTETINGEEGASRSDYTASEDDNVLVQGISGDKYSLGYFGFAYYIENADKIKVVPIINKDGETVEPTEETINNGSYNPLSRPLLIYVNKGSLEKPEVKEFVNYYLTEGTEFISEVGYVKLPTDQYDEGLTKIGSK